MYGLVAAALVAYTAIALLFKAAAPRTHPDQLVVVALATVTLLAVALMILRGEWGGTWSGGALALVSGTLFYFASRCVSAHSQPPLRTVYHKLDGIRSATDRASQQSRQ